MEHPVDSEWNPYLEVPQVGLPEEVAHDVEAGRGLDGRLLAAAATAQAGADGPRQAAHGGQAAALVYEIPHHVIPEED